MFAECTVSPGVHKVALCLIFVWNFIHYLSINPYVHKQLIQAIFEAHTVVLQKNTDKPGFTLFTATIYYYTITDIVMRQRNWTMDIHFYGISILD